MTTLKHALDMIPGQTYRGTADGPIDLQDVFFTPIVMVTFDPDGHPGPPKDSDDSVVLIQVQYDAWAYPLPQSACFAPYDVVVPIGEEA